MIVNLQSVEIVQLPAFKKEIMTFPAVSREDLFSLVVRFLNGERLNNKDFKVFKIDKKTKVFEFKLKDSFGNWRLISTIYKGKYLVFIYAFHKKSQALLAQDKNLIRQRIRRIHI